LELLELLREWRQVARPAEERWLLEVAQSLQLVERV
jgi:hypothetical protein